MECIFEERDSKAIVKDYYTSNSYTKEYREPQTLYKVLMDMVESDPILFTAVSLTSDLVTYNGYDFIGTDVEKARTLFNEKLDFDQVVDNLIWSLIVYGDAYLELVWNESHTEIVELHPLDTTEMVIDYDKHGIINKYLQKVSGKGQADWIPFAPDEVIYFRMFWVGTQVYSRQPFKSITRAYATKVYSNNYLQSIFMNLPPKLVYFLKNANAKQTELFIENLKRAKTNPNTDIIAQGDAFETKVMEVTFDRGLSSVLEYLRKEVLMVTRVPPHWIGILDGANRGIGENVVIPYETKIKKIQQKIESQINRELMPKLNLDCKYKFNSISLMDEKSIVEIMNFLKAQGFDSETIIEYARNKGLNLRIGAEIQEIENNQVIQNETAMSRGRMNKQTDKMNTGVDKKGVSEEGRQKLKAEQGA